MFVTEVGAAVTTLELFFNRGGGSFGFVLQICLWLWFTVLFANFAEAMAEGRGKAQADALRKSRTKTHGAQAAARRHDSTTVPAESLAQGRRLRRRRRTRSIPADGEIIEGAATVDESAITGESAPVIREAGGDRSAVTGGTTVLSDQIKVRVTANPGESFMDRMIEPDRRRQAAEDAQRNRAVHPALGAHDHLPGRLHHAQAVRDLHVELRRARPSTRP